MRVARHFEARPLQPQSLGRAVHSLTDRRFAFAQHRRDLAVVVVERLPQQVGRALFGAQPFEQVQEGDGQLPGTFDDALGRLFVHRDDRLRKPGSGIAFALAFGRAQPIDGQPRDDGHQPSLRGSQRGLVRLQPAQPRVLQHVLGVGAGAEHAVGDAMQPRPQDLERVAVGGEGGFECVHRYETPGAAVL